MENDPSYYSRIIDFLNGSLTDEEAQKLIARIQQSEEQKQQFEQIKQCWNNEMASPEISRVVQNWQKLSQKIDDKKRQKQRRLLVLSAIAATFVIFFSLPGVWNLQKTPNQMKAALSEGYKIDTLADGTLVYLFPASAITTNTFTQTYELTGSAYFVVPPRKRQPLVIALNHSKIKVHGTAFRVFDNRDHKISLTVESGLVEWVPENRDLKPLFVSAGEEAVQSVENNLWGKGATKEDIYVIYQPEIITH